MLYLPLTGKYTVESTVRHRTIVIPRVRGACTKLGYCLFFSLLWNVYERMYNRFKIYQTQHQCCLVFSSARATGRTEQQALFTQCSPWRRKISVKEERRGKHGRREWGGASECSMGCVGVGTVSSLSWEVRIFHDVMVEVDIRIC